MDQDQRAYVEVEMEDDNGSVQECTEEDANDLLGPRSSSGLSDHLQAVSLEVGLDCGGVLFNKPFFAGLTRF